MLILLILPLTVRGIRTAEESGQTEVRVVVFAEGTESETEAEAETEAETKAETETETEAETKQAANRKAEDPADMAAQTSRDLPLEQALVQRLVSGTEETKDGLIRFYLCGSEQQVKDEVASRRAECGYVVGEGLRQRLEKKDHKRSIRVYSAPSTVAAGLSTEVVFASLMELYDKELLAAYVRDEALFDEVAAWGSPQRDALAERAGELYETWLYNGSTFRFETVSAREVSGEAHGVLSGEAHGSSSGEAHGVSSGEAHSSSSGEAPGIASAPPSAGHDQNQVFPVRGIVAVYIFIIGLYAAAMNLTDERRGLFLAVPYNCRTACRLSAMAAPVFLAAVSGMAAVAAGGVLSGFMRELSAMILYTAAVIVCSWLLRTVVKSPEAICCLIPFFLVGSLLFCPVIIDVGRYIPALGPVGKWFLPWYYLNYFS